MSHIDDRLDLDNAIAKFIDKHSGNMDDFVLYFRHSYKDGEGMVYTSHAGLEDGVPYLGDINDETYMGDPEMYAKFQETVLTLAAGICQSSPEVKKLFLKFLKNGGEIIR